MPAGVGNMNALPHIHAEFFFRIIFFFNKSKEKLI